MSDAATESTAVNNDKPIQVKLVLLGLYCPNPIRLTSGLLGHLLVNLLFWIIGELVREVWMLICILFVCL